MFSELSSAMAATRGNAESLAFLRFTLGIPTRFLSPLGIACGRIHPHEGGSFDWSDDRTGTPAVIMPSQFPVTDINDDLAGYLSELMDPDDLIAVDARDPGRWWSRRGDALFLNETAIRYSQFVNTPLNLFSDPLAWMRAAGAGGVIDWKVGAVVVDWGRLQPYHLSGIPRAVCGSIALAERIQSILRPPSLPELHVAAAAVGVAA